MDSFADGRSMRIALLIICTIATVTGCGRRGPLDDATLEILSRTGMRGADLTYPDGYNVSLPPEDYDMMRSLIASLHPIQSVKQGTLDSYDYRLVYIAGMDSAIIDVKLGDDSHFIYKWDEYIYTGGNAQRFRDGANAIRKKAESLSGDEVPAAEGGEPADARESPSRAY